MFHNQGVLFKDRTLTQDAAAALEVEQRLQDGLEVQVCFRKRQVVAFPLFAVLNPRKMNVKVLERVTAQRFPVALEYPDPFVV